VGDHAAADAAIERFLRRTEALVTLADPAGRATARALLEVLVDADRDLERRLQTWARAHGGGGSAFTEQSLLAYREQVQAALLVARRGLGEIVDEAALRAVSLSLERTTRLLRDLEAANSGIVRPLRLDEAVIARVRPSLLARHATCVDRYGAAMVRAAELELSRGLAAGETQLEMVERLIRMRGPAGMVSMRAVAVQPGMVVRVAEEEIPEGLFVRYRSWAWRIVRTEVAEAQNATAQAEIEEAARELPDMKRKILAVLDQRTARDSIGVHGQGRGRAEHFRDGAGREYLRPPSRPHDRETLVPWRPGWDETRRSRPLSKAEQDRMWERNSRWQAEQQARRTRARRAQARPERKTRKPPPTIASRRRGRRPPGAPIPPVAPRRQTSTRTRGNPAAISRGFGDLSRRQRAILDQLPGYGNEVELHRRSVSMRDLAAMTAKTGVEFLMLTRRGKRLIIRGWERGFDYVVTPEWAQDKAAQGWRLSGHTHRKFQGQHPSVSLMSSDGDRAILEAFGQRRSCIYNEAGDFDVFEVGDQSEEPE